jgi:hypothetical protein
MGTKDKFPQTILVKKGCILKSLQLKSTPVMFPLADVENFSLHKTIRNN